MTHKQLLADFYLKLLSIPVNDKFRIRHQGMYAEIVSVLAFELGEDVEIVQNIFESMAREDER